MDGILDLFGIKKDAEPVDVIRGGKELRERQGDLKTGVDSVTEELMRQNPELFNKLNIEEDPTTTDGITGLQPRAFTAINNLYNRLNTPRVGSLGIMDLISTGKFVANPSITGAIFSPIPGLALAGLAGLSNTEFGRSKTLAEFLDRKARA